MTEAPPYVRRRTVPLQACHLSQQRGTGHWRRHSDPSTRLKGRRCIFCGCPAIIHSQAGIEVIRVLGGKFDGHSRLGHMDFFTWALLNAFQVPHPAESSQISFIVDGLLPEVSEVWDCCHSTCCCVGSSINTLVPRATRMSFDMVPTAALPGAFL